MATILIVDDLSANRKVLVQLLRDQGHRLLEAADGRQGLDVVHSKHPDLVITDVLMPVMDGIELVRQLRLDPATSRTPVVFYTAHYGEREAKALAESSGVAYVLTKPVEASDVLRIVRCALDGESLTASPGGVSPPSTEIDREHLPLVGGPPSEQSGSPRATSARLRALLNVGLELASEQDPDRLLHRACVAARDVFGATYVTIGILDLRDKTVQRFFTCGADASCQSRATDWIKPGDPVSGILQTVVAERRTVRGENVGGDPATLALPSLHQDVHAFLAAPIVSPAHVYGWICLVGNEGRTFTEDEEHLVKALAAQIGRLHENLSLNAAAQKRSDELQHEVLERQKAEAALREERDRSQRYLDRAEVILLALNSEGKITLVNRHACSVFGWTADELLGRDFIATCVPARIRGETRTKLGNVLAGPDSSVVENAIVTRSGQERMVEWRNTLLRDSEGRVVGTLSSGADMTERHALEQQYLQAQKMEAIGQLAGGVAHDFNNLLTVILGSCELLLADCKAGDSRHEDIEQIRTAGERAAGLTRQLLAFSRKQVVEPTRLDLSEVVSGMRAMLGRLIREDVKVVLRLGEEIAPVKADRGQVEQIVMNLAVNAQDAMPRGGTLTIETANAALDEQDAATHPSVKPGPYSTLTVTDTGTGMTAEVQARLFEPFFTTKEVGKGTGLGLATVHRIVTGSGGSVDVSSEVGRGTSFIVYFPSAQAVHSVGEASPLALVGDAGEPVATASTSARVETGDLW